SPAPAPQAKCTKRADPDRKILPACKPPPIRDRKTESANPRYGEGFFSKLLGQSNKEIARSLRIGPATVKNHVHNVLEKLQVTRRGEVAACLRGDILGTRKGNLPVHQRSI